MDTVRRASELRQPGRAYRGAGGARGGLGGDPRASHRRRPGGRPAGGAAAPARRPHGTCELRARDPATDHDRASPGNPTADGATLHPQTAARRHAGQTGREAGETARAAGPDRRSAAPSHQSPRRNRRSPRRGWRSLRRSQRNSRKEKSRRCHRLHRGRIRHLRRPRCASRNRSRSRVPVDRRGPKRRPGRAKSDRLGPWLERAPSARRPIIPGGAPGDVRSPGVGPGTGGAARGGNTTGVASRSGDASGTGSSGITRSAIPSGGYQVQPAYPATARRLGIQGTSLLRVHVAADGRVTEIVVAKSAGHADMDQAATDAVRQWRFEPGRRGSEAVGMWVWLPIEFRIK